MRLHFQRLGEGPPMVLLHGLLGSGDNWLGIAPQLAARFQLLIPDLRNHGRSPHADFMDFATMAEDVWELVEAEDLGAVVVVGHSLGGKVAMQMAAGRPERVRALVVEDIAPREYGPVHAPIFAAMQGVDLSGCSACSDVDARLAEVIPDKGLRQFLLKNLGRDEGGRLHWRCHLTGIRDNYDRLRSAPVLPVVEVPALFINGSESDHVRPEDEAEIRRRFPRAELQAIAGAGHWVHAQRAEEFVRVLLNWLERA